LLQRIHFSVVAWFKLILVGGASHIWALPNISREGHQILEMEMLRRLREAGLSAWALGLAVIFTGIGATYGAAAVLKALGVGSIFATVRISDQMKIFVSLYLTGAVMSLGLSALALFMISKGRTKYAGWLGISAFVCNVVALLAGPVLAVTLDIPSSLVLAVGAAFGIIGGILELRTPSAPIEAFLTTMQIANSAVLSALTAILTGIAFVPSPTGGYTHLGDTIIFMASLLFGSKVGALTGVIGSVAADLWVGYPRWFVSIPAHGLEGLIAGLARRRSLTVQVICCAIGGIVMASVYFYVNIFIKGWALAIISYVRDLLGQAGVSLVLAIVLTRTLQRILPSFKA